MRRSRAATGWTSAPAAPRARVPLVAEAAGAEVLRTTVGPERDLAMTLDLPAGRTDVRLSDPAYDAGAIRCRGSARLVVRGVGHGAHAGRVLDRLARPGIVPRGMTIAAPARLRLRASMARHAPLFRNLVRREVRQRYKGSTLGLVWTLITPAIMVAAYSLVFSSCCAVDDPELRPVPVRGPHDVDVLHGRRESRRAAWWPTRTW